MKRKGVLAVVTLPDASRDQRVQFPGAMLDRNWKATRACRNGYVAAFEGSVSDDAIVDHSEREISECAVLSGIHGWDAVCVLNEVV